MKFLLLCTFFAVALANQGSIFDVDDEKLARGMARMFEIEQTDSLECVNKTEATLEDIMYTAFYLDTCYNETQLMKYLKRTSCLMVCCAQKRGMMVKGEIIEEEIMNYYQNITTIPEEMLRNSVRICKEQVTEPSDECMIGFQFGRCFIKTTNLMSHLK